MNVTELIPFPTARVQFKLAYCNLVPKFAGCYVLTTFEGLVLYIGLANNFSNRFKQHLENAQKTATTEDGKAIWFYFQEFDATNLPKLERSWLNQFISKHGVMPILNKVFSPIR